MKDIQVASKLIGLFSFDISFRNYRLPDDQQVEWAHFVFHKFQKFQTFKYTKFSKKLKHFFLLKIALKIKLFVFFRAWATLSENLISCSLK